MPNITIKETDLTSAGSLDATSNIVYVPGLALKVPDKYSKDSLKLYSNLADFQEDFGDRPPIIKFGTRTTSAANIKDIYDTGFIYATELLRLGMPVLYHCLLDTDNTKALSLENVKRSNKSSQSVFASDVISALQTYLSTASSDEEAALRDKGLYNIKFLTSGGYVTDKLNQYLETIAKLRSDCCALEDILPEKTFTDIKAALTQKTYTAIGLTVPSESNDFGKYAAAFAPWGLYAPPCLSNYSTGALNSDGTLQMHDDRVKLPGSFGYLVNAASNFSKGVNNWLAIAGAARGTVPYLVSLDEQFSEPKINNVLQKRSGVSINPIATINPFGDLIWGNRTLFDNSRKGDLTASSFLNIRNLISDIKKTVFKAARQMTFEQNSAILWLKFKSLIVPTLDKMVSGSGLSGYELTKKVTKTKAMLVANIRLFAIEAVEDFDITIELADDTAAVTE